MNIILVSREDFIKRYETLETKLAVTKALKKWDAFLQSKNLNESDLFVLLKSDQGNQKYVLLDQLVRFPIPRSWFGFIKSWIKYNDIIINDEKLKDYVRWPKVMREREKGIDKEIVTKILKELKPIYRKAVLIAIVTGVRMRSELLNKMEWSWIDFDFDHDEVSGKPVKITIPAKYTKTKQERITFITPQAVQVLKAHYKDYKNKKVIPRAYSSFYCHWVLTRNKLGLTERKMNGMFQTKPHRFRGYTENKLSKNVGEEFAHALTGHGNYLGQYFAGGTTDEEAASDYAKAIKDLTIENFDLEYEPHNKNDTPK